jgi:hypothetical protein
MRRGVFGLPEGSTPLYVRKQHSGASSHGFEWPEDGSVVEVPDHIGGDLLTHAPGEFSDVTEEHPAWLARQAASEPDAEADTGHPGDEADNADPAGGGDAEADGPAGGGDADASADAALEKPKRKYTRRTPAAE